MTTKIRLPDGRVIAEIYTDYGPYCPSCGACGDDGCCLPTMCKHDENCQYPHYRNDLFVRLARWMFRHHMSRFAKFLLGIGL